MSYISITITYPETVPSLNSLDTYDADAELFFNTGLPGFVTQLNNFGTQVNNAQVDISASVATLGGYLSACETAVASADASAASASQYALMAAAAANYQGVWSASKSYTASMSVSGSDGEIYVVQTPSTGQNPVADTAEAYWKNINKKIWPRMAYGNLDSPLLHLPLKKNLLTAQGQSVCTFTRASAATYADRYGMLKSVAANTPRFTADGLLIEGASTNLLTYSEQFENGAWSKTRATVSANTTAVTDPFGTNLADKIVEDTTASQTHQISQTYSGVSGAQYTLSIYAKAAELTQFRLFDVGVGGGASGGEFNLSAGTASAFGSGYTVVIRALADGWFRCSITFTCAVAGVNTAYLRIMKSGSATYTGDGTSGLYIFGAQLEAMPFATSYIPTTTASATRAAESCAVSIQDNMVQLQRSTGHTFVVDATLPISSFDKIALGGDSSATRHLVGFYSTQLYTFNARGGAVNNVLTGIDTLKKHRYAVVFAGTASEVYLDGMHKGRATTTYTGELASTIYVGSAYDGRQLSGEVSNLRIYDRALTAEEVRLA